MAFSFFISDSDIVVLVKKLVTFYDGIHKEERFRTGFFFNKFPKQVYWHDYSIHSLVFCFGRLLSILKQNISAIRQAKENLSFLVCLYLSIMVSSHAWKGKRKLDFLEKLVRLAPQLVHFQPNLIFQFPRHIKLPIFNKLA